MQYSSILLLENDVYHQFKFNFLFSLSNQKKIFIIINLIKNKIKVLYSKIKSFYKLVIISFRAYLILFYNQKYYYFLKFILNFKNYLTFNLYSD